MFANIPPLTFKSVLHSICSNPVKECAALAFCLAAIVGFAALCIWHFLSDETKVNLITKTCNQINREDAIKNMRELRKQYPNDFVIGNVLWALENEKLPHYIYGLKIDVDNNVINTNNSIWLQDNALRSLSSILDFNIACDKIDAALKGKVDQADIDNLKRALEKNEALEVKEFHGFNIISGDSKVMVKPDTISLKNFFKQIDDKDPITAADWIASANMDTMWLIKERVEVGDLLAKVIRYKSTEKYLDYEIYAEDVQLGNGVSQMQIKIKD